MHTTSLAYIEWTVFISFGEFIDFAKYYNNTIFKHCSGSANSWMNAVYTLCGQLISQILTMLLNLQLIILYPLIWMMYI